MPVFGGLPTDSSAINAAPTKLNRTTLRIAIIFHLQWKTCGRLPATVQEQFRLAGIHNHDVRQTVVIEVRQEKTVSSLAKVQALRRLKRSIAIAKADGTERAAGEQVAVAVAIEIDRRDHLLLVRLVALCNEAHGRIERTVAAAAQEIHAEVVRHHHVDDAVGREIGGGKPDNTAVKGVSGTAAERAVAVAQKNQQLLAVFATTLADGDDIVIGIAIQKPNAQRGNDPRVARRETHLAKSTVTVS